jgi:hypothetical protein
MEKKKRKENGKPSGFRECWFFFLLKPWQCWTGSLPRSCRVTYKTSRNKGL